MIQLNHIDKYIESRFQRVFILKGIELTINQGEFITLMGPSGVGKSTLLNIIGLLDEDFEGDYSEEWLKSLSEEDAAKFKEDFALKARDCMAEAQKSLK